VRAPTRPEAVVHFLEPDIFAGERVRHADPVTIPANAAVPTDETDFEVRGILQRRHGAGRRARRGLIDRGRCVPLRANMVETHRT